MVIALVSDIMAAEKKIIISEILCFVNGKFGMIPKLNLQTIFENFYELDAICIAKKLLHDVVTAVIDDPSHLIVRQRDKKKKRESEDLINLYEIIDKEMYEIPTYVAADVNNIPNVSAENADKCVIMAKMMNMQKSICLMRNQLNEVLKLNSNLKKESEIEDKCGEKQSKHVSQKEILSVNMPIQMNNDLGPNNNYNMKKITDVIKDWEEADNNTEW